MFYQCSGLRALGDQSPEVSDIIAELNLKVSMTEYGAEPHLLFLQFGKGVRVKAGPLPPAI